MSVSTQIPNSYAIHYKHIADAVSRGKVILFIGAGVSMESGVPSGWDLAQKLANEIGYQPESTDNLSTIAEYFDREMPGELTDRLVEWIFDIAKPSPSHTLIPKFPWQAIYTTNFDDLIEQGYLQAKARFESILYNSQLRSLPDNVMPIIKIHGCLSWAYRRSSEAPIVLTDQQYEAFGPHREILVNRLRQSMFEGNILLFIGYSLRDRFWQDLRTEVAGLLQQHTRSYYAVMPKFSVHAEKYWSARQVRLIPSTAELFLKELSTLLP